MEERRGEEIWEREGNMGEGTMLLMILLHFPSLPSQLSALVLNLVPSKDF